MREKSHRRVSPLGARSHNPVGRVLSLGFSDMTRNPHWLSAGNVRDIAFRLPVWLPVQARRRPKPFCRSGTDLQNDLDYRTIRWAKQFGPVRLNLKVGTPCSVELSSRSISHCRSSSWRHASASSGKRQTRSIAPHGVLKKVLPATATKAADKRSQPWHVSFSTGDDGLVVDTPAVKLAFPEIRSLPTFQKQLKWRATSSARQSVVVPLVPVIHWSSPVMNKSGFGRMAYRQMDNGFVWAVGARRACHLNTALTVLTIGKQQFPLEGAKRTLVFDEDQHLTVSKRPLRWNNSKRIFEWGESDAEGGVAKGVVRPDDEYAPTADSTYQDSTRHSVGYFPATHREGGVLSLTPGIKISPDQRLTGPVNPYFELTQFPFVYNPKVGITILYKWPPAAGERFYCENSTPLCSCVHEGPVDSGCR